MRRRFLATFVEAPLAYAASTLRVPSASPYCTRWIQRIPAIQTAARAFSEMLGRATVFDHGAADRSP